MIKLQTYNGRVIEWDNNSTPPPFYNLVPGQGCAECDNPRGGPTHTGGSLCRSHSLASGGNRTHCSCDGCY